MDNNEIALLVTESLYYDYHYDVTRKLLWREDLHVTVGFIF